MFVHLSWISEFLRANSRGNDPLFSLVPAVSDMGSTLLLYNFNPSPLTASELICGLLTTVIFSWTFQVNSFLSWPRCFPSTLLLFSTISTPLYWLRLNSSTVFFLESSKIIPIIHNLLGFDLLFNAPTRIFSDWCWSGLRTTVKITSFFLFKNSISLPPSTNQ